MNELLQAFLWPSCLLDFLSESKIIVLVILRIACLSSAAYLRNKRSRVDVDGGRRTDIYFGEERAVKVQF